MMTATQRLVRVFLLGGMVQVLFASVGSSQSYPLRGPLIAGVVVEGCRHFPSSKLLPYLQTKVGHEYSPITVRQDMVRLAESLLCRPLDVRTEQTTDGRVNVLFVVEEYKNFVREVAYEHNKHVDVKELQGITRVKSGMPMNPDQNRLACHEIQNHLKDTGYYFANVALREGFADDHERVVFHITEGPKVRVRRTLFIGHNELATSSRLRTQIETSRAFLGTISGVFHPATVDLDVAKITEYYRSNGYLDVQVARELKFSDDFLFVDVVFHIQESTRYRVAEWSVEGARELPRKELAAILLVKRGDYYSESVISKDLRNLTDYGGWRGYLLDAKRHITEIPDRPGEVRVQYILEHKS